GDFRRRPRVAQVCGFAHKNRINYPRRIRIVGTIEVAARMREANAVVGKLQALVEVHFAPAPDAAVAVLVGGEVHDGGLYRVGSLTRSGKGNVPVGARSAIGQGATILHEAVNVRMGDVAPELAEFSL